VWYTIKILRLWTIFEMMSSLEVHIIYCIIFVVMPVLCLRLGTANLSASELMDESTSTAESACKSAFSFASTVNSAYCTENLGTHVSDCYTENSDILAALLDCIRYSCAITFLPNLKWLVISAIFKSLPFTNARDIFISKFHELVAIYKGALSSLS
jgi:hypothetical protein